MKVLLSILFFNVYLSGRVVKGWTTGCCPIGGCPVDGWDPTAFLDCVITQKQTCSRFTEVEDCAGPCSISAFPSPFQNFCSRDRGMCTWDILSDTCKCDKTVKLCSDYKTADECGKGRCFLTEPGAPLEYWGDGVCYWITVGDNSYCSCGQYIAGCDSNCNGKCGPEGNCGVLNGVCTCKDCYPPTELTDIRTNSECGGDCRVGCSSTGGPSNADGYCVDISKGNNNGGTDASCYKCILKSDKCIDGTCTPVRCAKSTAAGANSIFGICGTISSATISCNTCDAV